MECYHGTLTDVWVTELQKQILWDCRVCDRLKKEVLPVADYVLDTTHHENPHLN
ncbi:hypothetical protein [Niabella aquatica]